MDMLEFLIFFTELIGRLGSPSLIKGILFISLSTQLIKSYLMKKATNGDNWMTELL